MIAKRPLTGVGILAACIALLLAALAMLPPGPGVTKANYDRIEVGMTLAEVQEIFGKEGLPFHGFVAKQMFGCYWENTDRSYAIIAFDGDGKVLEKFGWGESPDTVGDKIRRWLHWPWFQ